MNKSLTPNADGFAKQINNWDDLASLIEHFSYFSAHDWLFRGVTDESHSLTAKIGRPFTRATKTNLSTKKDEKLPYRKNDEMAVFQMFKEQGRSHLSLPPETDLEWLAIAQHFGLPTRLIDWTESLLVAIWFAVVKAGAKDVNSAIWVTRGLPEIGIANRTDDPFNNTQPKIYRPAYVSPRIAAQASVLMICPEPIHEVNLTFSHKIVISRKAEFILKKRLNACGINKRALFPDLQGLAEHLSWLHKHDYLASHRATNSSAINATPDEY